MISPDDRRDTMRTAGLFAFASTIVVCLLWLPFGFGMVGHIEEWDILSLFTRHGVFFFAGEDSPLATHRLRPLTAAPNAVAYLLTPDSFVGMHLLQMLSLIAKGFAAAYIGYWLFRSRLYAVALGLLMVVFPADTMQLSFRSFHINCAVALGLVGVAGILRSLTLRESNYRGGLLLAIASSASLAVAVLIYEVSLIFVPFPLLLLWARDGLRSAITTTIRQWPVVLTWSIATLGCLAYIYSVLSHGPTYQSSVVGDQATDLSLARERAMLLITTGLGRSLMGGWIDAAAILIDEYQNYLYLICATLGIGTLLGLSGRQDRHFVHGSLAGEKRPPHGIRIVLLGVVMTAFGYLPFLSSAAHIAISQRTFLFSTFGAALTSVGMVLALLGATPKQTLRAIVLTMLISLGFAAQMYQFQHYQIISDDQRHGLQSVVKALPDVESGRSIVLLDGSQRFGSVWMLRDNMMHALTYLYDEPINIVRICSMPGGYWQQLDRLGRPGRCIETADAWVFTDGPPVTGADYPRREAKIRATAEKQSTSVLQIDENGSSNASAQQIKRIAAGTDALSRRYEAVLADDNWPLKINQFRRKSAEASVRWDFGRWWSLEVPAHGIGWQDAQWSMVGRIKHASASWANLPQASLLFETHPVLAPYVLKGRIIAIAPGIDRSAINVKINGETSKLVWLNDHEFYAYVAAGVLVAGKNELVFDIPLDMEYYGLGFALDWLTLDPERKQ